TSKKIIQLQTSKKNRLGQLLLQKRFNCQ
ncbi:hypothetical protein CWATWH0003_1225t4, partial [Crocosphaera watsonii WH 0003]